MKHKQCTCPCCGDTSLDKHVLAALAKNTVAIVSPNQEKILKCKTQDENLEECPGTPLVMG